MEEIKRQAQIEASRGTLEELCHIYVTSLKHRQAASAKDVKNCLNHNVMKAFPHLAARQANTITPDDLIPVFQCVLERGVTRTYNMLRSNLKAAFNLGMRADHDPREQMEHSKKFSIQFNPVDAIPRYAEFDKVRKRTLTNEELGDMWLHLDEGKEKWSPLYSLFLRFCIACFGNRTEQLNHIKWSDIGQTGKILTFIDTKGKNAAPKERTIPLTDRALNILREASLISGGFDGPFIISGKAPISMSKLGKYLGSYNDWLQEKALSENQRPPERFTAKDLRRTAARIMDDIFLS